MNRLIIIGNGFDLAHGLPTSDKHFIDDFWKNIKDNYQKEEFNELIEISKMNYRFLHYNTTKNYNDFIINLKEFVRKTLIG